MAFPSHCSCLLTIKRSELDHALIRLTKLTIITYILCLVVMVICINARLMYYNCNIASLQCGPAGTRRKESSGWRVGPVSSTRCDSWALLTPTREKHWWRANGLMVIVQRGRQITSKINQKEWTFINRMTWGYLMSMSCMDWWKWCKGRQGILSLKHRMRTRHTSPDRTGLTNIGSNTNDETILSLSE